MALWDGDGTECMASCPTVQMTLLRGFGTDYLAYGAVVIVGRSTAWMDLASGNRVV